MREHSNPKAYLHQFAQNKLKYKALGILLNHLLNKTHHSQIYIEDIDYFIDTLLLYDQLIVYRTLIISNKRIDMAARGCFKCFFNE